MTKNTAREPRKIYFERFIFMAMLLIMSAFLQGARAVAVCALSVGFCMLADAVCCRIRKMPYDINDSAVPFWGLAAAMMMPASIPLPLIALSSAVCVVVGKHLFGDSDNIVFCPPAISTAFMLICYPAEMLCAPKYGERYPVFGTFDGVLARSSEYSLKLGNTPSGSFFDILMGLVPGTIGAAYVFVIIVCGVCLIIRRGNSLPAVVSCLTVSGILAFCFPRAHVGGWQSVFYELTSGYLLFGTVFLSAEPYRIPEKNMGKVIYGAVLGYTTMMFRFFGQTEGSFLFALLVTGALGSSFDRVVENLVYWKKTYVNSFEKSKTQVQRGDIKLTDTQEIVLPEKYRYNTPPIDGEIKKHRRRQKGDNDEQK